MLARNSTSPDITLVGDIAATWLVAAGEQPSDRVCRAGIERCSTSTGAPAHCYTGPLCSNVVGRAIKNLMKVPRSIFSVAGTGTSVSGREAASSLPFHDLLFVRILRLQQGIGIAREQLVISRLLPCREFSPFLIDFVIDPQTPDLMPVFTLQAPFPAAEANERLTFFGFLLLGTRLGKSNFREVVGIYFLVCQRLSPTIAVWARRRIDNCVDALL
jgi:hypothetical protein